MIKDLLQNPNLNNDDKAFFTNLPNNSYLTNFKIQTIFNNFFKTLEGNDLEWVISLCRSFESNPLFEYSDTCQVIFKQALKITINYKSSLVVEIWQHLSKGKMLFLIQDFYDNLVEPKQENSEMYINFFTNFKTNQNDTEEFIYTEEFIAQMLLLLNLVNVKKTQQNTLIEKLNKVVEIITNPDNAHFIKNSQRSSITNAVETIKKVIQCVNNTKIQIADYDSFLQNVFKASRENNSSVIKNKTKIKFNISKNYEKIVKDDCGEIPSEFSSERNRIEHKTRNNREQPLNASKLDDPTNSKLHIGSEGNSVFDISHILTEFFSKNNDSNTAKIQIPDNVKVEIQDGQLTLTKQKTTKKDPTRFGQLSC